MWDKRGDAKMVSGRRNNLCEFPEAGGSQARLNNRSKIRVAGTWYTGTKYIRSGGSLPRSILASHTGEEFRFPSKGRGTTLTGLKSGFSKLQPEPNLVLHLFW